MTNNVQANVEQPKQEAVANDKELNFRRLEAKFQRELAEERAKREEAERIAKEAVNRKQEPQDEEDDSEPYVDKKKLHKTLNKFGEQTRQTTQTEIQKAVKEAQEQAKQEAWLENNPDFYDVLETNANKLAMKSPALAKSILAMPDNFERQKLVYQSIKELGLDKPAAKEATIQQKVDANRRTPYYQPSGVGAAPYANAGDFSATGQKSAYDKMQELKSRLRI